MDRKRVPPPPGGYGNAEYNSQGYRRDIGYSSVGAYSNYFQKSGQKRKIASDVDDESYFDECDEVTPQEDDIISACPFLSEEDKAELKKKEMQKKEDEDEEVDPLDAFMAGIETEVNNQSKKSSNSSSVEKSSKGVRDDLEKLDDDELYYKFVKENPNAGKMFLEDEDGTEYDEDGNPIPVAPINKKIIEPLPPVYHSEIEYLPFEKDFYKEHEEITKLTKDQISELRTALNITVSGISPPKPISSFAHFGFDEKLLSVIRRQNFTSPTSIQAQGVPCILSGRDVIGIAETGSGKTATFVWPLLTHIMAQDSLKEGDGPIGLIITPTRELCQQIHQECRKFGRVFGIETGCCFGGGNMYEQQKVLTAGCEIVVATPGRIIDHVKKSNTNLSRVTFLVLDEADRMFDMGFEYQVRSIANNIRPDRQTLLFSATFRRKVERMARDTLRDPIRIQQGHLGQANADVTQIFEMFKSREQKWKWLTSHMASLTSEGSLLVFVTKKVDAQTLADELKRAGHDVTLIHGDMNQYVRNDVIADFKRLQVMTMIATDVAARGLDIPSIKNVINYDVARDVDTHVHRIGRTGRAGQKGRAFTFLTNYDAIFACDLVRHLEDAGEVVPETLMRVAMTNTKFRRNHGKNSRILNKERPGLGANDSRFVI